MSSGTRWRKSREGNGTGGREPSKESKVRVLLSDIPAEKAFKGKSRVSADLLTTRAWATVAPVSEGELLTQWVTTTARWQM